MEEKVEIPQSLPNASNSTSQDQRESSSTIAEAGVAGTNTVLPPIGATVATPYGEGGLLSNIQLESTHFTFQVDYPWGKCYIPCTFTEEGRIKQRDSIKWRKKLFEMTTEEKIARAEELRQEGNASYKKQFYHESIHKYEIAKVYLNHLEEPGRPNNSDREQYIFPCLNNISLAYLNVNDYQQAINSTTELIHSYEENHHDNVQVIVKALYTRARSFAATAELESAYKDLLKACKLDPQSHKLRDEFANVKKKIKQAEEKQKQMFKAAFEANQKDTDTKTQQDQHKDGISSSLTTQTLNIEESKSSSSTVPNLSQETNESESTTNKTTSEEKSREENVKPQIEGVLKSQKSVDNSEKKKKSVKLPKQESSTTSDFAMNILSAAVLVGLVIGSAYLTTSIMSKSKDRI